MKKIRRIKIICYALFLITLLIFTAVGVDTKVSMAAEGISQLKVNKEGVASWKPFSGAEKYSYACSTFGGEVKGASLDLKGLLASNGKKSGTYMLMIMAIDSKGQPMTGYASVSYQYVSTNDLKTPQNLNWKGFVATWDTVKGADYYEVYLYRDDGDLVCKNIAKDSSYDYTANPSMQSGHQYYFKVLAKSNANGSSSFSVNSGMQKLKTGSPRNPTHAI